MHDFNKLKVWQESFLLNKKIYAVIATFPNSEIYGLTNQIRRASVSICSNIAEGCGRGTKKDFVNFLYYALGSTKEVECQIKIASSLKYLDVDKSRHISSELIKISNKIFSLIKYNQV